MTHTMERAAPTADAPGTVPASRWWWFGIVLVPVAACVTLALVLVRDDGPPALGGTVRAVDGPLEMRSQAATVALGDGTVLVWGGRNISTDSGNVFDPTTNGWEHLPAAPGPRRFGAAAVWTGTEAVIWGGSTSTSPLALDRGGIAWNPATQQWRTLPPAPHGLLHARAIATEHGVLFTGGDRVTSTPPPDLWFDLRDETWTAIPNDAQVLNVARHEGQVVGAARRPIDVDPSTATATQSWAVLAFDEELLSWEGVAPDIETEWLALASGGDVLSAVTADHDQVRAHVLAGGAWTEVDRIPAAGAVVSIEPSGYPPVTVWTGDVLVLGGQGSLVGWDPWARELSWLDDPRIRTFGGTAVWTGREIVSLSSQSSEGWTWTPAPASR